MEDQRDEQQLSPVERHVQRSFIDPESGFGKPLSRRARQTKRSVEAYLRGNGLPRFITRLREIDQGIRSERARLERAYRVLLEQCGDDDAAFARRWRERAREWRFDELNELIRQHNEWYPVETDLPMDPRTRDYVLIRGRSYRKPELGPEWVLEQFPV